MMKIEKDKLYTVGAVAEYFGISERTIYNGVAPKAKIKFPLKPIRINKLLRFKGSDILDHKS
jgi:predicted DNA-binding transcriptional regulator AlpA